MLSRQISQLHFPRPAEVLHGRQPAFLVNRKPAGGEEETQKTRDQLAALHLQRIERVLRGPEIHNQHGLQDVQEIKRNCPELPVLPNL